MRFPRVFGLALAATGLILSGLGCDSTEPNRNNGQGGTGGEGGNGGAGGGACTPTDDANDCTDDTCDMDGKVVHTAVAEGSACDDNGGAKCTTDAKCVECLEDADCAAPDRCDDMNACVPPTCTDTLKNGTESDVDCGGADCSKCDDGKICAANADCVNDYCDAAMTCQTPTCADGVKNADETDVDCGGGCAPAAKCADLLGCAVADDCVSGVCKDDGNGDLVCFEPACSDGVVNGTEGCDDGNLVDGDGCDSNCMPTGCGNGVASSGEACDDGNQVNGDGCDNNCTATACGNGIPTGTEACDDGNQVEGDGCDTNCTASACGNGVKAPTEACDDGDLDDGDGCDSNCTVTACGNGVKTGIEACDDGNNVNGDGCDTNCTATGCGNGIKTSGELCDDGNQVEGDGCDSNCTNSYCGNGVKSPTEACDDGNNANGDGCDADCSLTGCGNGIQTVGEACDDGNQVEGDGCDTNCTASACGNGIKAGNEVCDDGNQANGDGCDSNCTATACGNGILTAGEICDDGGTAAGDGCSATCAVEAGYVCNGGSPTVCAQPEIFCNDGIDNNGTLGTDAADPTCLLPAYVPACPAGQLLQVYLPSDVPKAIPDNNATGISSTVSVTGGGVTAQVNVIFNITHTYDSDLDMFLTAPGGLPIDINSDNGIDGDNFTNTVLNTSCATSVTTGTAPFSNCYAPENPASVNALKGKVPNGTWTFKVADDASTDIGTLNGWRLALCTTICGDGVMSGSEICDDGNQVNGDGCDTNCTASACGNGAQAPGEACDDGNAVNGDGCDTNCTISACGNGLVGGAETCDDGNQNNSDGCSSACAVEPGYSCTGAPSVCVFSCGNGTLNANEQCDDSNANSSDGCSSACQVEVGYQCTYVGPSVCSMHESLCSDGIDNDADGMMDAADADCFVPAYFPACAAGESLRVYKSVNVPKPIPDNNVTGVQSQVVVTDGGTIQRLAVLYTIPHTFVSDLDISLITPSNQTLDICSDNGSTGVNFTNTVLDTTCATNVTAGAAPFSGCYKPETTFATFTGQPANGLYALKAADDFGADTGTLTDWSLILCTN